MNSTVTDLSLYSFNDKLKSLEVKGPCCWVIFARKHFRGQSKQFCNGKFKSSTMIGADLVGKASSLKISVSRISKNEDILEDDEDLYLDDLTSGSPILKDCEINLYPKTYLRGSKTTITNKMNSTVTDLSLHSFNDKLKSLEVKGPCCWRIFAFKHFRGPSKQFCNGKFKSSTVIGADLV